MDVFAWRSLLVFMGLSLASLSTIIRADPLIEKTDRLELDWGSLKVRFYGIFKSDPVKADLAYSEREEQALGEGLLRAREVLARVHREELLRLGLDHALAERSALLASEHVTHTTYPYQTSYYKGGGVKLFLESSLAAALAVKEGGTYLEASENKKKGRFSGLILRLDKAIKPISKYEVVDQSGVHLFGSEAITKVAYEKNLMGHWFLNPQRDELIKYVGSKPVSIQARVLGPNRLMVPKGAWTDALQDSSQVLSEARIALVVPN